MENTPNQLSQVPGTVEMGDRHKGTTLGPVHITTVFKEKDCPCTQQGDRYTKILQAISVKLQGQGLSSRDTRGWKHQWGPLVTGSKLPGVRHQKIHNGIFCAYSNWPRVFFHQLRREINHLCLTHPVEEGPGTMPDTQ